jgi:anti-sigma factor RsiW
MSPELEAKLSLLLDGELAPEEAAALRAELLLRPELAARLAELEAVDLCLRELPARAVPAELRAGLAERIRREAGPLAGRAPRRIAPRAPRRWLAAAALVSAAAALALVVLPRLQREESPLAQTRSTPAPRSAPAPTDEPDVALAEDLPVIEVLDVLAELDELEVGSG